jgi:hypothetical protein
VFTFEPSDVDRWIHVVCISDNGHIAIYKDGMLAEEKNVPLGATGVRPFAIGYDSNTNSYAWFGSLDDIRIYGRPLLTAEIAALFNEGVLLTGTVTGRITARGTGLAGVDVKLLDQAALPVPNAEVCTTDADGFYAFADVPIGDYQVMVIEPLGYTADQNPKAVTVSDGETSNVEFSLMQLILSNQAEKWSYWKHQFDQAVRGKASDESPEDLGQYIARVQQHYTPHFTFFPFTSFADWQDVLRRPKENTARDKALAEVAALVLNFASLKLDQYAAITADDRTAGDVLTFVSNLIASPNSGDIEFELAKGIAAMANHGDGHTIEAGVVPPGNILYKGSASPLKWGFDTPESFVLGDNFPNPFNPSTMIRFDLPLQAFVSLKVYDNVGREVATLVDEEMRAGAHVVSFDATQLSSGMYFYRLCSGTFIQTKKMLLLK